MKNKLLFCLLMAITPTLLLAESLYNEGSFKSLVSDESAYKVGDSLTILIIEVSKAESNISTEANQDLGFFAGFDLTNRSEAGDLELNLDRASAGKTSRKGELKAQVSGTLVEEDSNGRFLVQAQQRIMVNGESQEITVNGWIRREDIAPNNTALSTRLVNAEISYTGVGDQSDANKSGWIYKFFTKIGLI